MSPTFSLQRARGHTHELHPPTQHWAGARGRSAMSSAPTLGWPCCLRRLLLWCLGRAHRDPSNTPRLSQSTLSATRGLPGPRGSVSRAGPRPPGSWKPALSSSRVPSTGKCRSHLAFARHETQGPVGPTHGHGEPGRPRAQVALEAPPPPPTMRPIQLTPRLELQNELKRKKDSDQLDDNFPLNGAFPGVRRLPTRNPPWMNELGGRPGRSAPQ